MNTMLIPNEHCQHSFEDLQMRCSGPLMVVIMCTQCHESVTMSTHQALIVLFEKVQSMMLETR